MYEMLDLCPMVEFSRQEYCYPNSGRNLQNAISVCIKNTIHGWMILGIVLPNFCFPLSVTALKDPSWASWEDLFCRHWDGFWMEWLHGRCYTGWRESSQRGTTWCFITQAWNILSYLAVVILSLGILVTPSKVLYGKQSSLSIANYISQLIDVLDLICYVKTYYAQFCAFLLRSEPHCIHSWLATR